VSACHRADAVLAGSPYELLVPATLSEVRFGIVQGMPLEGLDATVAATFERTLRRLVAASRARDVTLHELQLMASVNARGGIAPPEAFASHRALLLHDAENVDPFVRLRMQAAAAMPACDYIANLRDRAAASTALDSVFDDFDILLLPTTPIVAPTFAEVATPDGMKSRNALLLRNPAIANFFDLCAISLPMPSQGLPCGMMLFGRSGADQALFQVAAAVEASLASS
jgi:aspartyl-tRNA(Asn)/glutamyl-tRNA(Gln) amidotransferase subunit A